MTRYESLILAVPTITQDEAKNIESQVEKVIKENKGTMISFEKWGKYRLAYPVKKNEYGIYFLARFEIDNKTAVLDGLKTLMTVKLNDIVMRDMITALAPKQSLAYQRPTSLEETPTREVGGSFISERREAPVESSEVLMEEVDSEDDEDKE